jgi:hypothetical protein
MNLFDSILNKKEEYKELKGQINHDITIANKLGFENQVKVLGEKKILINDFIDVLESFIIDIQNGK